MHHSYIFRLMPALFVAVLLAACGGGGGGGTPAPSGLSYPKAPAFVVGQAISSLSPTVTGTVSAYSVSPALPAGLSLSASTGVISGTPTTVTSAASYVVTARNSGGQSKFSLTLAVQTVPPSSRFLYLSTYNGGANFVPGGIYAFGVDATTGALSPVAGSPFSPTADGEIAISRDSKFLYTSDGTGSTAQLWAFAINLDGSLGPVSGSPFTTPEPLGFLVTNPTSDFLYASGFSGAVMIFAIDPATGAANLISSVNGAPAPADYRGTVFTPNGQYLYTGILLSPSSQIVGFSANTATGVLSPVPGSPLVLPAADNLVVGAVTVDSMGKFLYVPNLYSLQAVQACCAYAFTIDAASGQLTPVPGSPFDVGGAAMPIVASGRFVIVGLGCSLGVLSVDPNTGALTSVPGSPLGPMCDIRNIAADPSGSYVYVGVGYESQTGGKIFTLGLDQATGGLSLIDMVPVPAQTLGSLALAH